jgi:putative ABC transport system ATP-binding protein
LHNLLPFLSSLENVELPTYELGISSAERRNRALDLLESVGLDDRSSFHPTKLSGGERQRVAVARALVNNLSIILADEPTGSLDSHASDEVLKLLVDLHEKKNVTLIVVTHDLNVANLAERQIEVLDGKIN